MERELWIYTKMPDRKLDREIISAFPAARITENESVAIEVSKEKTVIVLSQIEIEKQVGLVDLNTLFYIGVRREREATFVFDSIFELGQQLEAQRERQIEGVYRTYLEGLGNLSDDEVQYLKTQVEYFDKYRDPNPQKVKRDKVKPRFRKNTPEYRGIITVYNKPELAVAMADAMNSESLLLMEGDLLKPSLDEYLKISRLETMVESHLTGVDNTGFNIALDSLRKHTNLGRDISHIVKKRGKYKVLLGNYNALNYEHYEPELLKQFVETISRYYECVIISAGANIYDYLTLLSLNISDVNIICTSDSKSDVRWIRQMVEMLRVKQLIEPSKHHIYRISNHNGMNRYSNRVMEILFGKSFRGGLKKADAKSANRIIKELMK